MNSTITISGNLTRDPELKFTDDGMAMVRFGVASTRKVNEKETTTFYDIVAFRKMAENIHASLAKGNGVLVHGRLEVDEYTAKDGNQKTSVKIVADEVGALLRFATMDISRNTRQSDGGAQPAPRQKQPSFQKEANPWDDEDF